MSEQIYTQLREFMDKMPGGYPGTESGIEIRILKRLFSPDHAALMLNLKPVYEEASTIAQRIGMDKAKAEEKLEDMAKSGLIFRLREGEKVMYRPISFLVGVFEFQLYRLDRELAEMYLEYAPHLGLPLALLENKQLRVAPVDSAIEVTPAVATYNRVREFVKDQELIAMTPCVCRKNARLMGNGCDKPEELCFSFGPYAQYIIENNLGRKLSKDEALKYLDLAEDSALVLSPSNSQNLAFLCCCCKCCCGIITGLKLLPNPASYFVSDYQSRIDRESCTACGNCLDRCPMDAIKEVDGAMEVDHERCIGCGLCISTCPIEAIKLVEKEHPRIPPKEFDELLEKMTVERGLA